ncbi:hypothetical protein BDZ89DRAFT_687107 [Hymenopellis radicata]|nr:hypothetical protein BDZ89DRAFT_687107 [Hymenopellis radicata]
MMSVHDPLFIRIPLSIRRRHHGHDDWIRFYHWEYGLGGAASAWRRARIVPLCSSWHMWKRAHKILAQPLFSFSLGRYTISGLHSSVIVLSIPRLMSDSVLFWLCCHYETRPALIGFGLGGRMSVGMAGVTMYYWRRRRTASHTTRCFQA